MVRTGVTLFGSVSTISQEIVLSPESVHPLVSDGSLIWYANADAANSRDTETVTKCMTRERQIENREIGRNKDARLERVPFVRMTAIKLGRCR